MITWNWIMEINVLGSVKKSNKGKTVVEGVQHKPEREKRKMFR